VGAKASEILDLPRRKTHFFPAFPKDRGDERQENLFLRVPIAEARKAPKGSGPARGKDSPGEQEAQDPVVAPIQAAARETQIPGLLDPIGSFVEHDHGLGARPVEPQGDQDG